MNEMYVFEGTLVQKTGRRAVKSKTDVGRRRSAPVPDQYVYEIEPVEGDIKWKKWVKEDDLYIVENNNDEI